MKALTLKSNGLDDAQVLHQRAAQVANRNTNTQEKTSFLSVAITRVASEIFAIPANYISEIVHTMPITKLPNLPPYLLGLTHLRGELMTVLDIGQWLSIGNNSQVQYFVIVELQAGPLAIAVEQVLGFEEIWDGQISHTIHRPQHQSNWPILAITKNRHTILDPERLNDHKDLIVDSLIQTIPAEELHQ